MLDIPKVDKPVVEKPKEEEPKVIGKAPEIPKDGLAPYRTSIKVDAMRMANMNKV